MRSPAPEAARRSAAPPVVTASLPTSEGAGGAGGSSAPPPDEAAQICEDQHGEALAAETQTAPTLLEAAACYDDAGAVGIAVRLRRTIVDRFGESDEAREAIRLNGASYERIGHVADAARSYEDYARRYPKEPDARELLVKAACFRASFGDDKSAERNRGELVRLYRETRTLAELCP